MRQEFNQKLERVLETVGDAVTINETIEKVIKFSESEGVEVSGVMFYNADDDTVTEVHIDNIGDLMSCELDLVKLAPHGQQTWSFHTHPRYGITTPSQADMEIIESRIWEEGHCIFTTVDGEIVANCIEI